ncbi:MAG: LamG domain-containing protein [Limisphaerales bacterium]
MLANVTTSDTGDYSVTVTNAFGSARSSTNHLIAMASPNQYTTVVAQDSPAAYWPLNEATGTEVVDYSGGAHDGTNNTGTTLGVPGPRPPTYAGFDSAKVAYQFDGGSGYIDCGTGPSLSGTNDFTVEAWINTTAAAVSQIIQQRDAAGYNGEYILGMNADGTLSFTIYGNAYQFNNLSSSKKVNDGQWHHVAAVRAGTTGVVYIDGIVAASQTSTTVAPLDATIKTSIGADVRGSLNYFNGMICDVAIYGVALSPSRIGLHAYTGAKGNAPVVLQVVPGGYIVDSKPSGTIHSGVNKGASWLASFTDTAPAPRTRSGVEVFGGNSQIVAPASPDLDSPNGTIMFWLQANAPIPGPGTEGAMLVDRRTTTGAVIVLDDAGEIFWQGQGGSQNSLAAGYVPDGNWHHVAVTYGQTTNDSISLYIDGVLATSPAPVTNAWSWPTNQEVELGLSHDTYWKKFNGQLDDFRIYSRVLSDSEISQVYASDAVVDSSALVLRYNFDTTGGGQSLQWPSGPLESSPTIGPSAVWTPVQNAASPYPFLPPSPSLPAGASMFYRVAF